MRSRHCLPQRAKEKLYQYGCCFSFSLLSRKQIYLGIGSIKFNIRSLCVSRSSGNTCSLLRKINCNVFLASVGSTFSWRSAAGSRQFHWKSKDLQQCYLEFQNLPQGSVNSILPEPITPPPILVPTSSLWENEGKSFQWRINEKHLWSSYDKWN